MRAKRPTEVPVYQWVQQFSAPDGDCVVYTRYRNRQGYGYAAPGDGRRMQLVHRLAWEHHHGPIPEGMYVLHTCDNPACFRIDHLWLGTKAENTADMMAKGRNYTGVHRRGAQHHAASISEETAQAILDDPRTGRGSIQAIADDYGVSHGVASSIRRRVTWAHLVRRQPL